MRIKAVKGSLERMDDTFSGPKDTFADFEQEANNRRYNLLKKFKDLKASAGQPYPQTNHNNNNMMFESPFDSFGRPSSPFFSRSPMVSSSFFYPDYDHPMDDCFTDQMLSCNPTQAGETEIPIRMKNGKPENFKDTDAAASSSHHAFSHQNHQQEPQHYYNMNRSSSPSDQGKVHHIPILVEGRDTPSPRPSSSRSATPSSSRIFGQQKPHQESRQRSPFQQPMMYPEEDFDDEPRRRRSPQPPMRQFVQKSPTNFNYFNNPESHSDSTRRAASVPMTSHQPRQQKPDDNGQYVTRIPVNIERSSSKRSKEGSEERQVRSETPTASHQQPKQVKKSPMDLVNEVNDELGNLREQVNVFEGAPGDKNYRFLDEMLTRLLIKLDNIESQGLDDVRSARKAAIVSVQECVNLLESKARKDMISPKDDKQQESAAAANNDKAILPRQSEAGVSQEEEGVTSTEGQLPLQETTSDQEMLEAEEQQQQVNEQEAAITSTLEESSPETRSHHQENNKENDVSLVNRKVVSAETIDPDEEGAAVVEDVMDTEP